MANVIVKPSHHPYIPNTIFTLGLFLRAIHAIILWMVDYLVTWFYVDGFWWVLAFGLIINILNRLISYSTLEKKNQKDIVVLTIR